MLAFLNQHLTSNTGLVLFAKTGSRIEKKTRHFVFANKKFREIERVGISLYEHIADVRRIVACEDVKRRVRHGCGFPRLALGYLG